MTTLSATNRWRDTQYSLTPECKNIFNHLKEAVDAQGFSGGVGIMMDVNNGEIIAMTSYPEYSNNFL